MPSTTSPRSPGPPPNPPTLHRNVSEPVKANVNLSFSRDRRGFHDPSKGTSNTFSFRRTTDFRDERSDSSDSGDSIGDGGGRRSDSSTSRAGSTNGSDSYRWSKDPRAKLRERRKRNGGGGGGGGSGPSPYHMAVVMLLGSLASGMPLASMFKVYTFIMCEVYDPEVGRMRIKPSTDLGELSNTKAHHHPFDPFTSDFHSSSFPSSSFREWFSSRSAPELPSPPQCSSPWVQSSTSSYSASMVTVGSILALLSLSRVTEISSRLGRKPLLLLTHLLVAFGFTIFRLSLLLPPTWAASILFLAVVISEASSGAPLRVAIQNYVVDTSPEPERAALLSFIEGFGQIGAFPSSTLGGLLASLTGHFFAPFYACVGVYLVAFSYVLFLVPESKRGRHQGWDGSVPDRRDPEAGVEEGLDGDLEDDVREGSLRTVSESEMREEEEEEEPQDQGRGGGGRGGTTTTTTTKDPKQGWRSRILSKVNFISPLAIFLPRKRPISPLGERAMNGRGERDERKRLDFRLLNLALVVLFEETFQVFLVPLLLLYNGERFGFDVLQNGYLVSILQSCRAIFLTAIFPPLINLARRWITKRGLKRREKKRGRSSSFSYGTLSKKTIPRANIVTLKGRGNGDATPSSSRIPTSSSSYSYFSSRVKGGRTSRMNLTAAQDWEISRSNRRRPSLYSSISNLGKTRTETLTSANRSLNRLEDLPDQDTIKRIQRGKLDMCVMFGSYLISSVSLFVIARTGLENPWFGLVTGIVGLQLGSGATSLRTALMVNAVQERDQTETLAANQVLCTSVNAFMPLLTSLVYGKALESGRPEIVWYFKSIFAGLASLASLALFWSHSGFWDKVDVADEDEDLDEDEDGVPR
ncbi:hypothetical protein IE53DRAFT_272147 [Violaceomyces palustris]|uniref:Uncharacterized protein n=1 Tax=Violaceomyces palustris TaxID=1673888 RepID=A0ACD0P3B9_9BASI|nr:hypothetical protein IE53DRAFT_272147 [Violaceomyces palustris]